MSWLQYVNLLVEGTKSIRRRRN